MGCTFFWVFGWINETFRRTIRSGEGGELRQESSGHRVHRNKDVGRGGGGGKHRGQQQQVVAEKRDELVGGGKNRNFLQNRRSASMYMIILPYSSEGLASIT